MTVNVSGDSEAVKRRLQERSNQFQQEFDKLETPEESFGLRLTALPVDEDVRFDHIDKLTALFPLPDNTVEDVLRDDLLRCYRVYRDMKKNGRRRKLEVPGSFFSSPLLSSSWKGSSFWQSKLPDTYIRREGLDALLPDNRLERNLTVNYKELHCDGLLEFCHISCNRFHGDSKGKKILFNPDWPLVLLANIAIWAGRIRCHASAFKAEYRIQIEIQCKGETEILVGENLTFLRSPSMLAPISNYSLDQKPADLLLTFYQHFWGLLGRDGEGYGKEGNGERYDEIEFEVDERYDEIEFEVGEEQDD